MGSGYRRERQLVKAFKANSFEALRLGGSGSGTSRDLPDVLAGNGVHYIAGEAKYSASNKQCYEDEAKADALLRFAAGFGARAVFFPRFSTDLDGVTEADWFVVPFDAVERTDSGNVRLNHSVVSEFPTFTEVFADA